MKPTPVLTGLILFCSVITQAQDVSTAGVLRLQGTVLEIKSSNALCACYFVVGQITVTPVSLSLSESYLGSYPAGSTADLLERKQRSEMISVSRQSDDYYESLLRWAETGVMRSFNWTPFQRTLFKSVRRVKLYFLDNCPTNFVRGKAFNILGKKTGRRLIPNSIPALPVPPPPAYPIGPSLNRSEDGKLVLMVYTSL